MQAVRTVAVFVVKAAVLPALYGAATLVVWGQLNFFGLTVAFCVGLFAVGYGKWTSRRE